jgi:hypothetical protein
MTGIYDQLLGRLDEAKEINFLIDEFYFLGFGFGSYILQSLLISFGHNSNFKMFVSFNGIFYNNDKVKDNLLNIIEAVLTSDSSIHSKLLCVMNNGKNILKFTFCQKVNKY